MKYTHKILLLASLNAFIINIASAQNNMQPNFLFNQNAINNSIIATNTANTLPNNVNVPINSGYVYDKEKDLQAYCNHMQAAANSESARLKYPELFARINQTETNDKFISVGVSKRIKDFKRSRLVKKIAQHECDLYRENLDAQFAIKYTLPNIEKTALNHKLTLIKRAQYNISLLLNRTQRKVASKNETIVGLYHMQGMQQKLEMLAHETDLKIAQIQMPDMQLPNVKNMFELERRVHAQEMQKYNTMSELKKTDNWDVNMSFGMRKNIFHNSVSNNNDVGVFFGINLYYNLGSYSINSYLDSASGHYDEWKNQQQGSLRYEMTELKNKLLATQDIENRNRERLLGYQARLKSMLSQVSGVGSYEADKFKTQLQADTIQQDIEVDFTNYKISLISNYLK
jgi:hypothetical protein